MSDPDAEAVCSRCRDAGWLRHGGNSGDPGFGHVYACDCTTERFNAYRGDRDAAMSRATMPAGALRQTFETFQANRAPEAAKAVAAWSYPPGNPSPWLLLYGGVGSGKSHLAFAAAHSLIEQGRRAHYAVAPTLLREFGQHIGAERRADAAVRRGDRHVVEVEPFERHFRSVFDADYLILDDLGAEKEGEWANEQLFLLIDGRYRDERPLLAITNVPLDELPERIASRLMDRRLGRVVLNKASDFRPRRAPAAGTEGGR